VLLPFHFLGDYPFESFTFTLIFAHYIHCFMYGKNYTYTPPNPSYVPPQNPAFTTPSTYPTASPVNAATAPSYPPQTSDFGSWVGYFLVSNAFNVPHWESFRPFLRFL